MRKVFQRAALWLRLSAPGATALGLSTLLSSATVPPLPDLAIPEVLAQAGTAVPYGFQGHSQNLNHLIPSPPPRLVKQKKGAQPAVPQAALAHPEKYSQHLEALKLVCPSLNGIDDKFFNPASWLTDSILPQTKNTAPLPRKFLEAAYFTIGYAPDTFEKSEALTALNKLIADSPEFVQFLDQKRTELRHKVNTDKKLIAAASTWASMKSSERQDTLSYVSRITLETLLPGTVVSNPRVVYLTKNYRSSIGYGLYRSDFNEVYIDGTEPRIRNAYGFAAEITVHESFHAFTSMLTQWLMDGKLGRNAALTRQAGFYHLFGTAGGSLIHIGNNSEGYRTSVGERGAWAFQLAASPTYAPHIVQDMFINRHSGKTQIIAAPPTYIPDAQAGTLPVSCLTPD